jgi:ATP-dependent DNA helicase DinG
MTAEKKFVLKNMADRHILDSFPGTPRQGQREVAELLEKEWDNYDVFVLVLPTAFGKSNLAMSVANWRYFADVTVPTNILLQQYLRDFPKFPHLLRKDMYECCRANKWNSVIRPHKDCLYSKANRLIRAVPRGLMNNYMYMALLNQGRSPAPTLVADEAHNLLPMIQEMNGYKMWQHDWHYPDWVRSPAQFLKWATGRKSITGLTDEERAVYEEVIQQLESSAPQYVFQRTQLDWLRGKEPELRDCILWKPVDVRRPKVSPIHWGKLEKLVLMSATFGKKDIESLGLDRKRVLIVQGKSPIPAASRPIHAVPLVALNYQNLEAGTLKVAEYVNTVLLPRHRGEKGVIHATYAQAELFRKSLKDPRFLFHDRYDKTAKYQEFLAREDDCVLVACGLYEGIDLPDDLGRWQVVAKVPWLSLADPAIAYKAKLDNEFYLWETAKIVIQACGRVARHENDFGATYIPDTSFSRLYKGLEKTLPDWFKEAIIWE